VTGVVCDANGHVFVLLRADCYADTALPTVIELAPDGRRLAAWGEDIADGHMLSIGPDGRIYVVDRDAHEIVVFDRTARRIGGLGPAASAKYAVQPPMRWRHRSVRRHLCGRWLWCR
jgi:peptidylglycine monooxygenase